MSRLLRLGSRFINPQQIQFVEIGPKSFWKPDYSVKIIFANGFIEIDEDQQGKFKSPEAAQLWIERELKEVIVDNYHFVI